MDMEENNHLLSLSLYNGVWSLTDGCHGKRIWASCQMNRCGVRFPDEVEVSGSRFRRHERMDSLKENSFKMDNRTKRGDEAEERAVGGLISLPGAWPWMVALYKDGHFKCGGVIISSKKVLTAAHCVDGFENSYFEVKAGFLRKSSYSPTQQIQKVVQVHLNKHYQREVLQNGIAILEVKRHFKFTRWVRPVCVIPYDPKPGELCTTVGWGSLGYRIADSDLLRDVQLPITPCTQLVDAIGEELCAGYPDGGYDTCQGDSGGPLLCKIPGSSDYWYVAGIVSHGESCAEPNKPGVYTRVSLFNDWILSNLIGRSGGIDSRRPKSDCPGMSCPSDNFCLPKSKIRDERIDCLYAEDEISPHKQFVWRNFKEPPLLQSTLNHVDDSINEDKLVTTISGTSENKVAGVSNGSNEKQSDHLTTTRLMSTHEADYETDRIPGFGHVTTEILTTSTSSPSLLVTTNENPSTIPPVVPTETIFYPTLIPSTTASRPPTVHMETSSLQPQVKETEKTLTSPSSTSSLHLEAVVLSSQLIKNSRNVFKCKMMKQYVDKRYVCDGIKDCEDGTDEANCTCKITLPQEMICDSRIDCYDKSDEENCPKICSKGTYTCVRSNKCVETGSICDGIVQCPRGDDEEYCFALIDGNTIQKDARNLLAHSSSGIVYKNRGGQWEPDCLRIIDQAKATANLVCGHLDYLKSHSYGLVDDEGPSASHKCMKLWVNCSSFLNNTKTRPWHSFISFEGERICSGVLVNPSWVLTNIYCVKTVRAQRSYLSVTLGVGLNSEKFLGIYEQNIRVDNVEYFEKSDLALLHLEQPASLTHMAKPLTLRSPMVGGTCEAIGTSSAILLQEKTGCPRKKRCYYVKNQRELCKEGLPRVWSGVVVCRSGWGSFITSTFYFTHQMCNLSNNELEFPDIALDYDKIIETLSKHEPVKLQQPHCNGVRCLRGGCVSWENVIDGKKDCLDGFDELESHTMTKQYYCKTRSDCGCSPGTLRCHSGECIKPEEYCDGKADCADGSDETADCETSCLAYISMTEPKRICDGRVDCNDKTDENPAVCSLRQGYCDSPNKYKCYGGKQCIPKEFVCDNHRDCHYGDDEDSCFAINANYGKLKEGEIMTRWFGKWVSHCFNEEKSVNYFNTICHDLGFGPFQSFEYVNGSRQSLSIDPFRLLRVNNRVNIAIRPNRPFLMEGEMVFCRSVFIDCK